MGGRHLGRLRHRMNAVVHGYDGVSDAGLAMAIARYDQQALAEVYRRHAGVVFGLARRLLVDRSLAEDVIQEVFLRLWNDPTRYDPGRGSMRSYLLSQTHSRSVDVLRADVGPSPIASSATCGARRPPGWTSSARSRI